jgi:hypothetical protein
MSAIITFMFEPAKLQMNCASASGRISRLAEASGRSTATAELNSTSLDVDAAASERIDPAPPPGNVEQLEMADRPGERRVDHQVFALRLEPEHRPQEQ